MNNILPTLESIVEARKRISSFIHHTPVLRSSSINKITGADICFKCENFQKVGAFKFRGATNAVLLLPENEALKGVGTHSSGNHAAALALSAKIRGVNSYIVMPENSPDIKKKAVASYGAEITFCKPGLDERERTMEKILKQSGATFIHPYNNFNIISGQGTCALEFIEEVPGLDTIIAPVGGGGLLSGTAIAAKSKDKGIKVFAAEPKNADDAFRSFKSGSFVPSNNPDTIADGLLTSLGTLTYKIIMNYVDDIFTVDEHTIAEAMRMVWERMKIIIEPSAAVPLAVILENKELFRNKKTGIIISGGNVDLENLPF